MPITNEGQNRLINMWAPDSRSSAPLKNIANDALSTVLTSHMPLSQGTIVRSGVGAYDALVKCNNQLLLPCVYLIKCLGFKSGFGTSESVLLPEGTSVLVYKLSNSYGIILGALPFYLPANYLNNPGWSTMVSQSEGGVSSETDAAYKDIDRVTCNLRPEDVVPGNYVLANEQQVTMALLNLMLLFKATERAKLEMFVLDDFVRLTSGQFQHSSAAWTQHILSDYGYNTEEVTGSHHQCEMWGLSKYEQPFTENDTFNAKLNENTRLKLIKDDLLQRNRYQKYTGHLGGLFSLFIANPDPTIPITTYKEKQIDQGLLQTHIDGSGRFTVRSAGGICFQRTDKISIPKKLKEPWDPAGQKIEDKDPFEEKKAFEWDQTYPYARHLQMRDALAWYTKSSYQRFLELNEDWYLPDENKLKSLDEDYDKIGDKKYGNEKFKDQENKKSMLSMEMDGSIIIRDAWGSEIVMKGGNIILSCPGNIEVRPGKSIVALGGHDVVIKGRKSVDITATENDIRVKAEKNLHFYSADGGILVESNSPERGQQFDDKTGEQIVSSGIVLKAKKARVFIWADIIHLGFISSLFLEAYKSTKGAIFLLADKINAIATNQLNLFTTKAGLMINKADSIIYGTSAYVFGDKNSGVFKGTKFLAPMQEFPIEQNPYNQIQNQIGMIYTQIWDDGKNDEILGPYNIEGREPIKFKFRDDKEYGTIKATEVYKGGDKFVVYETAWSFLKKNKNKFIEGTLVKWKEKPVNETWPWPGKAAYANSCLVDLTNEKNIENDIMKVFTDIVNKPGTLTPKSMDELSVLDV